MVSLVAYLHHVFVKRSTSTSETDAAWLDESEEEAIVNKGLVGIENCLVKDDVHSHTTKCWDKATQTLAQGGLLSNCLDGCLSLYCVHFQYL